MGLSARTFRPQRVSISGLMLTTSRGQLLVASGRSLVPKRCLKADARHLEQQSKARRVAT